MTLTRDSITRIWIQFSTILAERRWIVWALFGLGLLRGLVGLLAYPPALGADAAAYYFYAQRLAGLEIPGLAEVVPPLYSVLILVSFNWLGSAYPLVALQWLMSATLAPLYYDAIKRLDPLLALVIALVVLFDYQTALMFNFISTEPLYMLLLAISFNLMMRITRRDEPLRYGLSAMTGAVFLLLLLTRAVARFLFVPVMLVHLLIIRRWRQTLIMAGGFILSLSAYNLYSQLMFDQIEGVSSSTYMVTDVVLRNKGWVNAENGPATAEFLELQANCEARTKIYICYYEAHENTTGLVPLLVNTALETAQTNLVPLINSTWDNLNRFLKLSGQQLGFFDEGTPGVAQCQGAESRINGLTFEDTRGRGWNWTWGARAYIENNFDDFRDHLYRMQMMVCPPLPDVPALREMVNVLNFRYRSLSRPNPMLWYGAAVVLALILPWARRRYLALALTANAYLFNHALISAVINNVQPRYVVVTNPFRAILLIMLVFIVVGLLLKVVDRFWVKKNESDNVLI